MGNILVYELNSILPLFKYKNNTIIRMENHDSRLPLGVFKTNLKEQIEITFKRSILEASDEEEGVCPAWVNRNIKLGEMGENIAENFLRSIYKRVERVSKKSSSYGYDIEADEDVFEVKTTTSSSMKFHITYHELKIACQISQKYNLFFINVDKKVKQVKGYIIRNPVEVFKLNYEQYISLIDLEFVTIVPNNFCIEVKEGFFQKIQENMIDLNYYC